VYQISRSGCKKMPQKIDEAFVRRAIEIDSRQNHEFRRNLRLGFIPDPKGNYVKVHDQRFPRGLSRIADTHNQSKPVSDEDTTNHTWNVFWYSIKGGLPLVIVPILFIWGGFWIGEGISKNMQVREMFEQIAGGLLVWTWATKIYGEATVEPFSEAFKPDESASASAPSHAPADAPAPAPASVLQDRSPSQEEREEEEKENIRCSCECTVTWFLLLVVAVFSSLVYVTTGHAGEDVFVYGVNNVTDSSTDSACQANLTYSAIKRAYSVHEETCYEDESDEQKRQIVPFYVGFALDGFTLILVKWKEVEERAKNPHYGTDVGTYLQFAIEPFAFSLDNLLTGAGLYAVTKSAYPDSVGIQFLVYSAFVVVGWFAGTVVYFLYEVLKTNTHQIIAETFRIGIISCAGLSFLDGGLELINNGLTFYVGLGVAFGWLLQGAEWGMEWFSKFLETTCCRKQEPTKK